MEVDNYIKTGRGRYAPPQRAPVGSNTPKLSDLAYMALFGCRAIPSEEDIPVLENARGEHYVLRITKQDVLKNTASLETSYSS